MGITTIQVTITDLTGKKKVSSEFLVDTGAAYTVVPKVMAEKLGLKPIRTVVIGQKDDSPLLGVVTLEGMGLMVDPFKRKLRPMRLMLA